MIKKLSARRDCRDMEYDEIIQTILDDRVIEDIAEFLHPSEEALIPFKELKNIDQAYQIIDDGITIGERFLVLFDCDVDGVSAGAIITRYLEKAGADVQPMINDGKKHGVEGFELNLLNDIDIMIVVDSLNNNPKEYKRITDTGCKLIVLDHHIPSKELLESNIPFVLISSAVDYKNSELSGAGVVLKMVLYMDEMNLTDYAEDLWWYAAAGIVGDMTSMAEPENRYIVSKGLSQYQHPIVKKLVGNYLFNTEAISFSIAPLINAAIRTHHNDIAVQMFLADDESEINEIYPQLKACREEQNSIVDSMISDLMKQGESQLNKKFMVFHIAQTDADITGLIGNRLLAEFQRPLIVIKDCGDNWSGSMRSVSFEISNFMAMVNDTGLARCDGHESAAGFTCNKDKFEEFKTIIENKLANVEFSIDVVADIEITPGQINDYLIKQLGFLNRISGKGFSPVTVLIRSDDYTVSTMSKGKHVKIIDNETGVIFVKWNDGSYESLPSNGEFVCIGKISNAYYGKTQYQQLVMDDYDIKPLDKTK